MSSSGEPGKLREIKMAISEFYRALREQVGTRLLLMPAVAAIVRDRDGRILVQQQHDDSWSLPAGAVEPGESPGEAIVREVLEETGHAVEPVRIIAVVGGSTC
jgi:8-oxo-dGTP pyrophosphatase MutT (NUDIX family)